MSLPNGLKIICDAKKTDEENLGHDLTQKNLGDKAFYKTRKEKVQNHLKFVFYYAELPSP